MASRQVSCWIALSAAALLSGCVERRFVIKSAPPGTKVYVNNEPVGFTPTDVPFTYYGTYNITLESDGLQTTTIRQRIAPPWYAYPPFDFIVENLYPGKVRDIREFRYDVPPLPQPTVEELRQQGEQLRERGRNLPDPEKPVATRNSPNPENASRSGGVTLP